MSTEQWSQQAAQRDWAARIPTTRGKSLVRLAELIEENARIVWRETEVRDNGKLYVEMSGQTTYMAEWYRYYGDSRTRSKDAVVPSDKPMSSITRVSETARGRRDDHAMELTAAAARVEAAVPALGGLSVVVKPSELTSASTLELMEIASRR